jgi:hypothetical protein
MEIAEIDQKIIFYEAELKKLEPTLKPVKSLPYSKVGLLNTARRKEKKYRNNINVLRIWKKNYDKIPEETIRMLLE